MRAWKRRAAGALLGLGLLTAAPRPAEASDTAAAVLVVVAAGLVISDVLFVSYDFGVAGKGELPSTGWAVAETVSTVPQTAVVNTLFSVLSVKEPDEGYLAALVIPVGGLTAMTTHGIWATATTDVRPGVLIGTSAAVGFDLSLTAAALSQSFGKRFAGRPMGIAEMFVTAPQIAAGVYAATQEKNPGGYIALSAWAGALFVHGLAATIRGGTPDEPPPRPPPPPPDPPPPPRREKPPLLVPASIHFLPTMVSDGMARGPGLGVVGQF